MKNYYEELEVSRTASKEVIEKVYKILAKKYHPDTTTETDKQAAEEKFKIISEAYEILSNEEKRKKYDLELEQINPTISYIDYINVINERDELLNILKESKHEIYNFSDNSKQYSESFNQKNNTSNDINEDNNYTNAPYYNTETGEPVSAFTYYKYKLKQFILNVCFSLLAILVFIYIIKSLFIAISKIIFFL